MNVERGYCMKAVMVGASNGIGLAMARILSAQCWSLEIFDRVPPEAGILPETGVHFTKMDLRYFDEAVLTPYVNDPEVGALIISAGYGRVAEFGAHDGIEIRDMITVNAVSVIRLIRLFYKRIRGSAPFVTVVMGSIAGWVSSPGTAVYAASKAALVRLIESVNIELEDAGTANRILDVSPASFRGSRFNGGRNDLDALTGLAEDILAHMRNGDTLFYPRYDEVIGGVLTSYHSDPHAFGLQSLAYKRASGRMDNGRRIVIGYLSGTFDLFHVGHLNLLRRAKEQCDYLIVGVHESGKWKGKETFIPFEERKQIVRACRFVDRVVDSCTEDADAWTLWHFDRLFVGSDYQGTERFRRSEDFFRDKGVEIIYFPYTQGTSSMQIRERIKSCD